MYISINWLKDYVDLDGIDIIEAINKFTLCSAEVEDIIIKGEKTYGVVIGQILTVDAHPNSKKLHLLTVDIGKEVVNVVCGAPNVRVGMKVALATNGGCVDGFEIVPASVGGITSYGMCCSGKELGVSDDDDGIMDLVTDLPLGTDINELLPIKDIIFEIDNKSLTNRPDLWCHYGIAREFAGLYNLKLKPLALDNLSVYDNLPELDININTENCFRYSGITVKNINEKFTPYKMQVRLYYAGMRSLNLLADLTNYLMLEVGQPMHAFDGEKVTSITVENAKDGDVFVTLDKQARTLKNTDTMIKCKGENVCIAGVMGGLESEITDTTNTLLLESATFDATAVRKTAGRLNLRSEASARYEKSLDPENTKIALARFLYLLKNIDKDIVVTSKFSDCYKKKYDKIVINTTVSYISSYIGVNLTADYIKETLERIGFVVDVKDNENLVVNVPTFRATKDISIPADLVEEVARMYGYDNIEPKKLQYPLQPVELQDKVKMEYEVKNLLAESYGFNEVYTYIWKEKKSDEILGIDEPKGVKITNSPLFDEIRTELTPTMLRIVNENSKHFDNIKIFEIARCVEGVVDNSSIEKKKLALAIASYTKSATEIYPELKNVIESIARKYNFRFTYTIKSANKNYLHPYNNAEIYINGEKVGFIGIVTPVVTSKIDDKIAVAVAEIDFNKIVEAKKPAEKYVPVSIYQATTLDFNFLVDNDKVYGDIIKVFDNFQTPLHFTYKLKDIYKDKSFGNKTSYTFTFEIVSYDHTMTGEEIETFHSGLIEFASKNNIILR